MDSARITPCQRFVKEIAIACDKLVSQLQKVTEIDEIKNKDPLYEAYRKITSFDKEAPGSITQYGYQIVAQNIVDNLSKIMFFPMMENEVLKTTYDVEDEMDTDDYYDQYGHHGSRYPELYDEVISTKEIVDYLGQYGIDAQEVFKNGFSIGVDIDEEADEWTFYPWGKLNTIYKLAT